MSEKKEKTAVDESETDKTAEKESEKAEKEENEKAKGKAKEEESVSKAEYDKAKAESEDFKRRLYAVTAEYDNYRKRTSATASQKYAEGRSDVIEKFFAIGDNLERALAIASDDKMKQGLEMVLKAYDKIMTEENVVSFDPKGEEFDASTSNAITALPADEGEKPGTVKMTFAKGYKRGDKVLRFAQVAVVKED